MRCATPRRRRRWSAAARARCGFDGSSSGSPGSVTPRASGGAVQLIVTLFSLDRHRRLGRRRARRPQRRGHEGGRRAVAAVAGHRHGVVEPLRLRRSRSARRADGESQLRRRPPYRGHAGMFSAFSRSTACAAPASAFRASRRPRPDRRRAWAAAEGGGVCPSLTGGSGGSGRRTTSVPTSVESLRSVSGLRISGRWSGGDRVQLDARDVRGTGAVHVGHRHLEPGVDVVFDAGDGELERRERNPLQRRQRRPLLSTARRHDNANVTNNIHNGVGSILRNCAPDPATDRKNCNGPARPITGCSGTNLRSSRCQRASGAHKRRRS